MRDSVFKVGGGGGFANIASALYFAKTRSDFAAVLNVRALDSAEDDDDKAGAIPMSSNGPWTKYGATGGGGALENSGSTTLSSALFGQSQTSADIVDIFRTVGVEDEAQTPEKVMNNGWCTQRGGGGGAPLAEKEVVSPTETILTRRELVNGFEGKLD